MRYALTAQSGDTSPRSKLMIAPALEIRLSGIIAREFADSAAA
jgi:hypothetical protein